MIMSANERRRRTILSVSVLLRHLISAAADPVVHGYVLTSYGAAKKLALIVDHWLRPSLLRPRPRPQSPIV